jgi:hypothetical protein
MAAALLGGTVAGAIIFRSIYTVPMNMVLSDTPEFALTANGTDLTALDWGTFHYGEIKTISANITYRGATQFPPGNQTEVSWNVTNLPSGWKFNVSIGYPNAWAYDWPENTMLFWTADNVQVGLSLTEVQGVPLQPEAFSFNINSYHVIT